MFHFKIIRRIFCLFSAAFLWLSSYAHKKDRLPRHSVRDNRPFFVPFRSFLLFQHSLFFRRSANRTNIRTGTTLSAFIRIMLTFPFFYFKNTKSIPTLYIG
jgi:hypothetical protein